MSTGTYTPQSYRSQMIRPSKIFQVIMEGLDVIRDANYGSQTGGEGDKCLIKGH